MAHPDKSGQALTGLAYLNYIQVLKVCTRQLVNWLTYQLRRSSINNLITFNDELELL
jgi:hypothetical protein